MVRKKQKEIADRWTGDINNPLVSISCITFNQEQYIAQALEGFLIQETSFPFEILVHDDASTDNTAAIIKEYEKKYPDIIKPIYQQKNQYSQGNDVSEINIKRAKGKYIAFCEGDDFWTDPSKLQKQVDYLEKNPNCTACAARSQIYNDTEPTQELMPKEPGNRFISIEEIIEKGATQAPTQTIVVKKEAFYNYRRLNVKCLVGDYPMLLYWGFVGQIYSLDEVFSVYRQNALNSWSCKQKQSFSVKKRNIVSIMKMLNAFNSFSGYKYNNVIFKKKISLLPIRVASWNMIPYVLSGSISNFFFFIPLIVKKILKKGVKK